MFAKLSSELKLYKHTDTLNFLWIHCCIHHHSNFILFNSVYKILDCSEKNKKKNVQKKSCIFNLTSIFFTVTISLSNSHWNWPTKYYPHFLCFFFLKKKKFFSAHISFVCIQSCISLNDVLLFWFVLFFLDCQEIVKDIILISGFGIKFYHEIMLSFVMVVSNLKVSDIIFVFIFNIFFFIIFLVLTLKNKI